MPTEARADARSERPPAPPSNALVIANLLSMLPAHRLRTGHDRGSRQTRSPGYVQLDRRCCPKLHIATRPAKASLACRVTAHPQPDFLIPPPQFCNGSCILPLVGGRRVLAPYIVRW